MKRIICLIIFTLLLSTQVLFADEQKKEGVCLRYEGSDCTQFSYCSSKTTSGCNDYETCTLENDKFSCVNQSDKNTKIYRPKGIVDEKVRNLRKPTYTSPIVEESRQMNIPDYFYPNQENSRYAPINQDIYKTYYPQRAEAYSLGETLPRRDIWVDSNPPYYKNFSKIKHPTRSSHVGAWPRF